MFILEKSNFNKALVLFSISSIKSPKSILYQKLEIRSDLIKFFTTGPDPTLHFGNFFKI